MIARARSHASWFVSQVNSSAALMCPSEPTKTLDIQASCTIFPFLIKNEMVDLSFLRTKIINNS
jgi:hypothetical protein